MIDPIVKGYLWFMAGLLVTMSAGYIAHLAGVW